ncbi:MAG: hypothetical protein ACM34H_06870 [Deltaproteobacteria bacterium]
MDKFEADRFIIDALRQVKGIVDAVRLSDQDRKRILQIEDDAERRSLMGLGKVTNTGVRAVADCDLVYVALNNLDFDWGCSANLLLKKGDEIVGEEIRDEKRIAELSGKKNAWFMHRNFVVYKDRVCFPQDIMNKTCHFEIPSLSAEWCSLGDEKDRFQSIIYANPSTPADLHLKENYFGGKDERGLGTILIGFNLSPR